jgi:uncharacterized repeat protein (TIGR01451 family)
MMSPFASWKRWFNDAARARLLRKDRRRRQLRLESLESRTLLAADSLASIAGTVYVDLTDNGLTADDLRLPNATVQLYRDGGDGVLDRGAGGGDDTSVGSQLTDASGRYRFDDLVAGTYFAEQPTIAGRLRRANTTVREVVVTEQDAAGVLGTPIDSYDLTTQNVQASSIGPTSASSSIAAPESLGGERDLFVELTDGTGRIELLANSFAPGMLTYASDPAAVGRRVITWDGADGDGTVLAPTGLGGLDLTEGGANVAMRLVMGADQDDGIATLTVYTDATNYSQATLPIPNTVTGAASAKIYIRLQDFVPVAGTGADFTNVGAVQLEIAGVAAVDGQIDDLGMIGRTVLAADFPYLPPMSIGDRVWRDANNNGVLDNGESGIDGVSLTLYTDTDGNGQWTPGTDVVAGNTTTAGGGFYRFENLMPGDYVVQVDPTNFSGAGALVGLVTSTGNEPTPDPDDNVDNDDNGDTVAGAGVFAAAVTLTIGGEPTTDGDGDPQTNLTVDFGFTPVSDLIVIKSDDPDPVVAGESLTYTLQVTNQGPSPVTGVVVTDTLPAGVAFTNLTTTQGDGSHQAGTVTVELGSLASGGSATITIVVAVLPSTTGALLNEAVVTGDNFDPVLLNNSDDEPTQVVPRIDLSIEKTDTPDPVVAGQRLNYTLLVTNLGPSDATGVTVEDALPAGVTYVSATSSQGTVTESGGTLTATLGNLALGAQATITIAVDVAASARGTLVNTASVSGNETETNLENNEDQVSTQINTLIDLVIDKTGSPDPVRAGETMTYQLVVTNDGPSNATGVTVVDTLPAGVTYVSGTASQGTVAAAAGVVTATLGDLAVGAQATVTLTVAVGSSVRGTLLNEATVSGNETERTLTNNTDEVSTQVSTLIDLAIDKTGSPDPVTPGQRLTYTLTVTNAGPSDATGVQVVDTLPIGVVFVSATSSQGTVSGSGSTVTAALGNLADGGQATITILADVAAAASGTLVNAATVSGTEPETNLSNNTDQVSTTIQPRIDLAIIKADSPDPVFAGGQLTYTLSVVNNGPSTATGVTVVDTLPTGITYQSATTSQGTVNRSGNTVTASVGQLASGATATVTILVTVNPATLGTITNVATVTGNETETNPANNQDDEPTQVQAQIDLAIAKTDSADPVTAGGQLTYTLVVTNNGPSSATGVVVTDTLPTPLTFVSGSSTSGTVSHASQVVTATVGNLASGQSATITLVTQVDQQFSGTITNTATVTGNETESNTNNNTASQPTVIDERLSSIAGSVYVDSDNDGQRDAGEAPIAGVVIVLSGTDAQGAAVQLQTTTAANGTYSFANLRRGTYKLTQQQPVNYLDGKDTAGSLPANTTVNDEFSNIQLPAGTAAVDYLFGERTVTFSKRRFLSSAQ